MESPQELIEALREGKITPEQAVEQFEYPARHISEVAVDDLTVDVLDCGFPTLNDYMVFKKHHGELIIFGARPSMGKSAFLFQVAKHMSRTGYVYIFSLEMDKKSIKARMIADETGKGLTAIQKGLVDQGAIRAAAQRLDKLNYYIDDRSGLHVQDIRASAKAFHKRWPLSLVVVDYLQLVKSRDRGSRNEEIGDVTGELKTLAKELQCPVLAASQLNRACEYRGKESGDYRPVMADLRDSGNIEQDADVIMFLSRQQVFDGTRQGEADIGIAKARNGKTGWEVFKFLGGRCSFSDPCDTL
jgi:replicative DNA helicase